MIYVANAGDSRSIACSLKGECLELSKDHKPDNKGESERIKKAGGTINAGRINGNLNLSRAIGDLEYKGDKSLAPEDQMVTANPDIVKIKNDGISFIIMGCDGIWEVKSNIEMAEWIRGRIEVKDLGKVL
jgi:serine/threonine protein phosphatase PrpC